MSPRSCFPSFVVTAAALVHTTVAHAGSAPFDLVGPVLEAKITRGDQTLPISEVPNLVAGDRIWIKADLPSSQSEHYLLILAFLRGSTNPPPPQWFLRCETWTRKCARDGVSAIVPQEARQVLVFLAPQTGGDFKTLVDAVRGRPGAFVRTSQDLNQATLDRSRLESYLTAVRALNEASPEKLKEAAPLLARSLAIKVNDKCLEKIPELQVPCLTDGEDSLILDDGHSTSIVQALTSGPASDLAMEASYTPQLSYGYYSPYVASVLDIARIFDSIRTAHYEYIPALASLHEDRLILTLNAPPSFHEPKSVLVTALPAIEELQLPPLHAINRKDIYCARNTSLVLPVEGAPLVFSAGYAHDLSLRLTTKEGKTFDLPATADAQRGGLAIDTVPLGGAALDDTLNASLHGRWGFDNYDGPGFQLVNSHTQAWRLSPDDSGKLVVGRENNIHLQGDSVSCIDRITASDPNGKELKAEWQKSTPNEVVLKLSLQDAASGLLTLAVTQYGMRQPQSIRLQAFSEAGHLDSFTIHSGDKQGILTGSRLDEVAAVVVKGITFVSGKLSSVQGRDQLSLVTQDPQVAAALKQGEIVKAKVTLKDGRLLDLKTTVEAPRPAAILLAKSVQPSPSSSNSNIQLSNPNELPQDATLSFSVRSTYPAKFAPDESIQVATLDESFSTVLSLANSAITLENSAVALAKLDTATAFGPSAFGALQFRVVLNGVQSDWQPLATLVRLPELTDLRCPPGGELACKLSGSGLFLLDSISDNAQFDHPVQVPDGFPGYALPVPHPTNGRLYIKLRDDPSAINTATLVARQLPSRAEGTPGELVGKIASPVALDLHAAPPVKPRSGVSEPANAIGNQDAGSQVAVAPADAAGKPQDTLVTHKATPSLPPN